MTTAPKLVLLATLLVGLAATVLTRVRGPSSRATQHDPYVIHRVIAAPVNKGAPEVRARLTDFVHNVGLSVIGWLRLETLVHPWRDDHVTSLPSATTDASEDSPLRARAGAFLGVVADFLQLYDSSTAPDPLILGGRWRIIADSSSAQTERDDAGSASDNAIEAAAARVCAEFDVLSDSIADPFKRA